MPADAYFHAAFNMLNAAQYSKYKVWHCHGNSDHRDTSLGRTVILTKASIFRAAFGVLNVAQHSLYTAASANSRHQISSSPCFTLTH